MRAHRRNRLTLSKLLNVLGYITATDTIDRRCSHFNCNVSDLMEYVQEPASASDEAQTEER